MNLAPTRTRLQQLTAAGLALGVLGAALGAEAAQAATVVATPTAPPFYVLKKPKAACKAHYVKRTVRIKRRRHGKLIRAKQVRCVYATSPAANGPSGASRPGGSGGGGPTFPVDLPTGTITVGILPTVSGHTYSTIAGQALNIGGSGVLAGASGSQLNAILVSGPPSGSLTLNRNGSFSYMPAGGISGIERFSFKATSLSGESSTPASVTIKVAPTVTDSVYSVAAGSTLNIPSGGLLSGTVGTGLSADLVSGPADGSLSLGTDGSATYAPAPGFTGADTFSYDVVDRSALSSNAATVTVDVGGQPPTIVPQVLSGAFPNTELQVGASSGGPAVHISATNALTGDSDPNSAAALTVTPGKITTVAGGVVQMSADGDFTYDPPARFAGVDSFGYTVNEPDGPSAGATATIHFAAAPRIWYVDDSAPAGGTGTSASPFDSLAALTAGAGLAPTDVVYLVGNGNPYGGGIALGPNESLIGSGAPLLVDGATLAGATAQPPVVTNSGGAGITLADGDSVAGVTVSGTSGDGIYAHGAGTLSIASSVSVTGAGGAELDLDGGNGSFTVSAHFSGAAANSVEISNRGSGAVTLSGPINGSGGVLVANDAASAAVNFTGRLTISTTGAQPAFAATGGGAVSVTGAASTLASQTGRALEVSGGSTIGGYGLTFQSVSAGSASGGPDHAIVLDGTGNGSLTVLGSESPGSPRPAGDGSGGTIENTTGNAVDLTNVAGVTLYDLDITNPIGDGIAVANSGAGGFGFDIEGNDVSGQSGAGIAISASGSPTVVDDSFMIANSVDGHSSTGNGIELTADNGASVSVEADQNRVTGVAAGSGIAAQSLNNANLALGLGTNDVTMPTASSQDGIDVSESGAFACVNPFGNTVSSGSGGYDLALAQPGPAGTFEIQAWNGASGLAAFLDGQNLFAHRVPGVSLTTAGTAFTGVPACAISPRATV